MGRRSDHTPQQLRQMILEASERIVRDEGPDQLTARKVAAEIGYTVGTLYNLYQNMDELILYLNAQTVEGLTRALRSALDAEHTPEELAIQLARAYMAYCRQNQGPWSLLVEHNPSDPSRPDWYAEKVQEAFHVVEEVLLPLTGDPEAARRATHVLWAGVHGITMLALREKLTLTGPFSAEALMEDLFSRYLQACAVPAMA